MTRARKLRKNSLFILCLKTRPTIIYTHFGSFQARKWWVLFVLFFLFRLFLAYWSFFSFFQVLTTFFCNFTFFRLHLYHLCNSRIRRVQSQFKLLIKTLQFYFLKTFHIPNTFVPRETIEPSQNIQLFLTSLVIA